MTPIAYIVHRNLWGLKLGFHLLAPLYSREKDWAAMMNRDLSHTTMESFLTSIASLRRTDLRPYDDQQVEHNLQIGDKDIVVDPKQWKPLEEAVPLAKIERFQKAGHFIMLDEPVEFMTRLKTFLDYETLN